MRVIKGVKHETNLGWGSAVHAGSGEWRLGVMVGQHLLRGSTDGLLRFKKDKTGAVHWPHHLGAGPSSFKTCQPGLLRGKAQRLQVLRPPDEEEQERGAVLLHATLPRCLHDKLACRRIPVLKVCTSVKRSILIRLANSTASYWKRSASNVPCLDLPHVLSQPR